MPIMPQPSSKMIPIATALNIVLVERRKRFWICQKAKMPTAWAAIPTMRRYVRSSVLYATIEFCRVPMTVTVVLRESPSRK